MISKDEKINPKEWLRVELDDGGCNHTIMIQIKHITTVRSQNGDDSLWITTVESPDPTHGWPIYKSSPSYQAIYDMFFGEGEINETKGDDLLNSLDNAIIKKIKEVKQQDEPDKMDRFNRYIDNIVGSKLCGGDRKKQEALVEELKEVGDIFTAPPTINKSTPKK